MHYHGHRQRLRERLMDTPEKLADYEILELLLGYVIKRRDTKPVAKELLVRFGSLRGVVVARTEEYADIPGLGKTTAAFITLLKEFIARYAESPIRSREVLCDPGHVAAMAKERLGGNAHEEVWVAYVDSRNRLLQWNKCSQGGLGSAHVNSRDIIEKALSLKAYGFILVHNHPGGDPRPSHFDKDLTAQINQAARTVFLHLIDHVIVCETGVYSIMADGFIADNPAMPLLSALK